MADMRYASSNSATTSIPESSYKVLRQTYMLLSMTLLWSAACAGLSFALQPPYFFTWVCFIPAIIMMFTMRRWANSPSAIIWVFVFTGLMGASLGPMLSIVIGGTANGGWLVMQSLAMTAGIFFFASGYVLTTKKDLSFMGGFLMTGLGCQLAASSRCGSLAFWWKSLVLVSRSVRQLCCCFPCSSYTTRAPSLGHQTNYVYATVGLYLNLNLFVHFGLVRFANDD